MYLKRTYILVQESQKQTFNHLSVLLVLVSSVARVFMLNLKKKQPFFSVT